MIDPVVPPQKRQQLSLEQVRQLCDGAWATSPLTGSGCLITDLATDTRLPLLRPAETLFIALRGNQRQGDAFLVQAYQKGIRCFLVSDLPSQVLPEDAAVVVVPDTLAALQILGRYRRQQFSNPVLAITGSNGKTIIKEWLYEVLLADHPVLRSPKSFNSQIGVPLSVWLLQPRYKLAIFEAGISQPGEMARLEAILQPTVGIFTNLGDAHQAGFDTALQKATEKALLFRNCKTILYCADYELITEAFRNLGYLEDPTRQVISWSATGMSADWQVSGIVVEESQTRFQISGDGSTHEVVIPFGDAASLENAVHCWLAARMLGVPEAALSDRMLQLHPVAMRLEYRRGTHDCTLLNDSYNSDLTSLRIALTALQNQQQHPHRAVILSDLLQSGMEPEELYQTVATLLQTAGLKLLVGIGPELVAHASLFTSQTATEVFLFENTAQFFEALPGIRFEDMSVLIKGARSFAFEQIVALLEQEVHRTVLTIDLEALTDNLRVYRSLLPKPVKVMAMVKAFAYGSGSHEIAGALQSAGVDYLTVAYTDEGVALREKGIRLPIMVMSPDVGSFERIIAWHLEPEIFNFRSLAAFTRAAQALGITDYPVHIKLNTGMNRLGFDKADLPKLTDWLQGNPTLRIASIFSHLAGSEDASLDAFTEEQAALFRKGAETISAIRPLNRPLWHLDNTSGIVRHPQYHFDMVRLGLGVYGIDSTNQNLPLRPVSGLRTTIAQLRTVAAGEGVSYGRGGQSENDRQIATVCIGYADGYPRALGHGKAYMLVRGRKAYTVGAVCMDMCMLDVTEIGGVREGDEVVVFGPELSPRLLAQWSGTITYEILTGISQRVKRVYLNAL
ncbi:MAG: bifunctional UDP-N-acetylmuramoyl-tripeptide:D-alanyl-D-alanine ligase/alanine racemase [Sphingobacteriales bacterium]|nr:MAG: bifunctional UDP-N-acetylmuramoyl-tripeptide:D-alanyl-D-alanine ligase/alanine racemase [Sphingobacteriales bacterium]